MGGRDYKKKEKWVRGEAKLREQEDFRSQAPSYPVSHRVRVKVKYFEVRKGNSSEAKGSQDILS